jgi:LysM repeat protein
MRKLLLFVLLALPFFLFSQKTSVVIHKVEKGQTLYAIAKKYGKTMDEIKKSNPTIDFEKLKYGQEVKIPAATKPLTVATNTNATTIGKTPLNDITHIVKAGETAYSIAKMYAISIDLLNKTNNLSNGNLQIGQSLVIPGSKGTTTIIKQENIKIAEVNTKDIEKTNETKSSTKTTVHTDEDVDITDPTVNRLDKGTTTIKTENTGVVPTKTNTIKTDVDTKITTDYKSESASYNFSLIATKPLTEQFNSYATNAALAKKNNKGVASYMKDASDTPTYIALFNASPIGSIVKVKNLMNGRIIYVKIVGKLPDLDKNKDLNIKVSESAAKALGVVDEKFLNEIEYYIAK